jgi:hypothetical protein
MGRVGHLLDRLAAHLPGGPRGNRTLTATLGALLLVGILAELVTLRLGLQRTLSWHVGIGLALIPLVVAKLASTGWRMIRYYTRDAVYRREGPPRPLLRGIAPAVVGATLALLGSGVALVVAGRSPFVNRIHGMSFALFLIVVGLHTAAHLPVVRRFGFADVLGASGQGRWIRLSVVGFALVAGGAVAFAAAQSSGTWALGLHHPR